jgi:hypothetical protein
VLAAHCAFRGENKVMTEKEQIARIINPDLYVEYDLLVKKGTLAENGKLWADVVFGFRIERLVEKADAIIALRTGLGEGMTNG